MKILLTKFDNNKLKELEALLHSDSSKIESANSVSAAKKTVNDNFDIDLIILYSDSMRSEDIEFLDYIKTSREFKWIPVIIATENCQSAMLKTSIEHGANDIVTYPFDFKTIKERLDKSIANGRRTVLVIDDEKGIIEIMKRTLELERFHVLTAESAEQGLGLLADHNIHAIISDIVLPGMTGMEFLARSKKLYKNIPIVLITGFTSKFTPEKVAAAGADGFFKKPFHNLELVESLRQILQKYNNREAAIR